MAAGHAELIGEMSSIEKMSMPDRLKHAKKRRAQQLKAYAQYEKQLNKEISKKAKKGQGSGTHSVTSRTAPTRLQFDPSILLLEATMRNDVEEGMQVALCVDVFMCVCIYVCMYMCMYVYV